MWKIELCRVRGFLEGFVRKVVIVVLFLVELKLLIVVVKYILFKGNRNFNNGYF